MKIESRWFQLCASLIAMIMIANLQYAWTLFVGPLREGNNWTLSDVQWAFTLFILFQTWIQPLDGWLIDRMGPRLFISVAGVLCGLGWAGLAYADTLPMLYTFYATAGIGAALVYSGSMGSALKWFKKRRGLATGILAAGFGGGTALFIPLISWTIQTHGYQTAFIGSGLIQGVVILCVAQFLRHPSSEVVEPAAPGPVRQAPPAPVRHYTTGEMLRTPRFYILYIMFVMMATGGLLVTAQAGPIARSWGLTAAALTLAASLSPIANGASRVFWGWASDRVGREAAMSVAFMLNAISLVLVLTLGRLSGGWFAFTLVLTYFTWGEIFALFPAILADNFGTRYATSNYGVLYSAKGIASIIGGGLAALLFERFGSWTACFYGSAVLSFAAGVIAITQWVAKSKAPARITTPVPAMAGK